MSSHRAIALMSGGLDSNLAVTIIHNMGIEIIGVHFTAPFCQCNRGSGGCIHYAKQLAEKLGLRFSTVGLGEKYLDIVVNPPHGHGSGMNPCLDCRIMMLRRAKEMMEEEGASFILTGEVLGQRPMSQLSDKLRIIEREAGLEGLILRPLSARNLAPTIPEKEGWIDREALLNIRGRGRRTQIDLAEQLEIGDYPCPAGGCLLTDKNFARRLREHVDHAGRLVSTDIPLLKIGRHFRSPSGAKIVVGRDEAENGRIERLAGPEGVLFEPASVPGPSAALRADAAASDEDVTLAAELVAAYSDGDGDVTVTCRRPEGAETLTAERRERTAFEEIKI